MLNITFYEKRKRLGLTRGALARELGMSPTTVNAYETGKHTVPKYVWLAMNALCQKMPVTAEMMTEHYRKIFAIINREH